MSPSNDHRDARALRILAKSVYRELRAGGYATSDVVAFANELLELVVPASDEGGAHGDRSHR